MAEQNDKFSGLNRPTTNLERFKQGFKELLTELVQFQRIWLNNTRTPVTTTEAMIAKTLESEFWKRLVKRTLGALKEDCTTDEISVVVDENFEEVLAEVASKDMSGKAEHGHPELKPLITNKDREKDIKCLFWKELLRELGEKAVQVKDPAPTVKMASLGKEHQDAPRLRETLTWRITDLVFPRPAKGDREGLKDTRQDIKAGKKEG